ncbi:hypothetical protein AJ80_03464 [Polytolypa hystricis UAMH7299]|uniref:Zn(2)-C6 fungal-type domain-containing protein n=1 Tax=Polytolypa hystricis (strain UAMH7299) TaxID=1447883 RepID=A0A2B7YJN1_POLH7|nr:hypothetical protein AJ80_03464 [Polytolypa hystricis UAMH7299]
MSRPQVSIDRLPARRMSNEPRESMNCKSCRKRKIKCNRTRPTCEACSVFQCPCIYDAIPKKRGPKTDVLEALLKRVDGLEKRLQDEKRPRSPSSSNNSTTPTTTSGQSDPNSTAPAGQVVENGSAQDGIASQRNVKEPPALDTNIFSSTDPRNTGPQSAPARRENNDHFRSSHDGYGDLQSPLITQHPHVPVASQPVVLPDSIVDTFFSRINGKPFYILDEQSTRQRHQLGQLPQYLSMAIYAVTIRYASLPGSPDVSLKRKAQSYAIRARQAVDPDNPSIEGLQTLLLLSMAFFANGQGKKTYMTLSNCVGMAVALDLYREVSPKAKLLSSERETRRRLFWTCYMLDRFVACGSKRPSLISDNSIALRLPSWTPQPGGLAVEGELFNAGPNINYSSDPRRRGQDPVALLIDIARILGITNQYLAAGGVKGDSHFPWHSLSNLSKIRQELDIWAAGTQDMFVSIEALFGHPECTTLLLSKLIYHLVHCLIYRPFLPIDLAELRGTGQHQSWQIEATNLCFSHSNAIAELVELGKSAPMVEWPSFVGYCVCTAGTVHVHGVHYKGKEGEVFASSAEFLAREMHQLSWLRNVWAGVQHQREVLQNIYNCHAELVRNLASNPMRFSPVFHLEDFFDRYPGQSFDGSHVRLADVPIDALSEGLSAFAREGSSSYSRGMHATSMSQQQRIFNASQQQPAHRPISPRSTQPHKRHRTSQHVPSMAEASTVSPTLNFNIPRQTNPPQQVQQPAQIPQPPTFSPTLADLPFDPSSLPNPFSPHSFPFSPSSFPADALFNMAPTPQTHAQYATFPFDPQHQPHPNPSQPGIAMMAGTTALTPGAQSQGSHGGTTTSTSDNGSAAEKDPFLSLLEQLAENEQNPLGGPSELDFFLAGAVDGEQDESAVGGNACGGNAAGGGSGSGGGNEGAAGTTSGADAVGGVV